MVVILIVVQAVYLHDVLGDRIWRSGSARTSNFARSAPKGSRGRARRQSGSGRVENISAAGVLSAAPDSTRRQGLYARRDTGFGKRLGGSIALAWAKVDAWINGFYSILPNLVLGLAFLILVAIAARIVKAAVWRSASGSRPDLGNVLGALLQWTIGIVGTLIAITIIFPGVGVADLLGTLGIGSIAIGFAFKDILQNLLAGILILLRQPFRHGDQIVSGQYEGTVELIETRATIIRTYDGRQVLIPNSEIYTGSVVVNTAFDKRRSEYDVGIGYGDDVGHAAGVVVRQSGTRTASCRIPLRRRFRSHFRSAVSLRVWWWTAPDRATVLRHRAACSRRSRPRFSARASTCRSRSRPCCSMIRPTRPTATGGASARDGRPARIRQTRKTCPAPSNAPSSLAGRAEHDDPRRSCRQTGQCRRRQWPARQGE